MIADNNRTSFESMNNYFGGMFCPFQFVIMKLPLALTSTINPGVVDRQSQHL